MEQFFAGCVNHKESFDVLVTRLTRAPYGMRRGVLPFYILDSLLRLENMPIIYLNKKEVVLDLETINNIVKHPKDYSLYVELETAQKAEYIHALETLFSDYSEYCREVDKKNRLAKISCMMQSWYRSLPQTSKTFGDPDHDGQDIKSIIAFRKLFTDIYLNPRDIIFERLPKIFKSATTTDTVAAVQMAKMKLISISVLSGTPLSKSSVIPLVLLKKLISSRVCSPGMITCPRLRKIAFSLQEPAA